MKKLTTQDTDKIYELVTREPAINHFIIGDLELYGFDDTIQEFFGEEKDGKLISIIMRFKDVSLCIYTIEEATDAFVEKIEELVATFKPKDMNYGETTAQHIGNRINHLIRKSEDMSLAVYTPNDLTVDTSSVVHLTPDHVAEIIALHQLAFDNISDEEVAKEIERKKASIVAKEITEYGILADGVLQTVVEVTAESSTNAMIVGVATIESARNKGYATKTVKKACDDLYANGKQAILFYNNPLAAKVYLKLGFEPIGAYYLQRVKAI